MTTLESCPFCAAELDTADNDTLYPSGTVWMKHPHGYTQYASLRAAQADGNFRIDGHVWNIVCTCGAEMHADDMDTVVALWNQRK